MTSQPGKQTIAIHILPNISRSKGNQTTKFGQFIEDNMRNIFLENSNAKYGREAIPRPFSKKSKLRISLDQRSEIIIQFVLLNIQVDEYQNILKLRCRSLVFTF